MAIFEAITEFMREKGVCYQHLSHEPTYTSAESAAARGEALATGAKALLLRTDGEFQLFVMSADRRLDSKKIKLHLGVRKTRFASKEELLDLTGLVPGSVPPFGQPILPFPLHIDHSVTLLERVAFNAGALTESIVISAQDYLRLSDGNVFEFTE